MDNLRCHNRKWTLLVRCYNVDLFAGLVLLDLSSAFDTIDHAVLFDLWHDTFGISGTALSLLKSYLQDRTQCVQIDGIISEYAKLVCGVPQGSVLGPWNFCMYMQHVPNRFFMPMTPSYILNLIYLILVLH